MTGSVRKRGDKWYYSFEAARVDGKRRRIERVGGRTKKEAESALRKALEEYEQIGRHFKTSEISTSDYMDYWYEQYVLINCKYNSQLSYKNIIENHIKPIFGIYKLKSLSPNLLQDFINKKFLNGISKNHLINISSLLNSSLKYAVYPGNFIKENPMQYVKLPKYEHSKTQINHKTINNDEFDKIITRFPFGSTFHLPILIGYYTGCRIGEVLALTWDDIDLNNNTIDINKIIYQKQTKWYFGSTKTKSSTRKIVFGQTLSDALKKYKTYQLENKLKYGEYYINQYIENDLITSTHLKLPKKIINMVCTKENGSITTPGAFRYASRVINYELGIAFNFHALRHTHATKLIENGANIKDVQYRLGHNNIQTTLDTYTHVTEKMSNQTVEIFENTILPTI